MNKSFFIFLLFSGHHFQLSAKHQQNKIVYFQINKQCPPFILNDLCYYPKRRVSQKDFQGKWLFLDLWDRHCAGCIAAFPKYNALQQKLRGKIQFILIGRPDESKRTQSLYEVFKKKSDLQLPCAFDIDFFKRYDIKSSPYIIVIDPKGIVRALTTFLTEQNINEFLDGKIPALQRVYRAHEKHDDLIYDPRKPLLVDGNGGDDTDFVSRSLLVKYNPLLHVSFPAEIKSNRANKLQNINPDSNEKGLTDVIANREFQVIGASIQELYSYAYFGKTGGPGFGDSLYGKIWPRAVFQVKDSSVLMTDHYFSAKNRYSYSLILPSSLNTRAGRMKFMQHDLSNYFGYEGKFVLMQMPCWRLVATDEARIKLKTTGGTPYSPPSDHEQHSSISLKNQPVSFLIYHFFPTHSDPTPFFDETGIESNIDITLKLNTMLSNFEELKKALEENGLNLVKGEKEMKVLVITEN